VCNPQGDVSHCFRSEIVQAIPLRKIFRVRTELFRISIKPMKPINHVDITKEPVGQIARRLDFLSDFDFFLELRPGNKHEL